MMPCTPQRCSDCTKELEDESCNEEAQQPKKKRKNGRNNKKNSEIQKRISLVKQKPIVKSPMFMTSTSSIYAAVCKYNSLLDALHGAEDLDMRQEKHDLESLLIIINIHFGGCQCSIFEQQFDRILSSAGSLCPVVIEEALHRSVRHLCDKECFLRAYQPIRDFTYLWRDIMIDNDCDSNTNPVSPSRRSRLKKENLLAGWSCKLLPAKAVNHVSRASLVKKEEVDTQKMAAERQSLQVAFISPDGTEFDSKTKAINRMNKSLSYLQVKSTPTLQTSSTASTALVSLTANIDPLLSPLGLLEELFLRDPWKLLVSTICLNVTTRQQVDRVLYEVLRKWPDAISTAQANWEEISSVVASLGLRTKRAQGLIRFSKEYLDLTKEHDAFSLTEIQVKSLYNIGQYGWTAYEVFILKRLPSGSVKVCDHALQLYVEYQLGRQASGSRASLSFSQEHDSA